MKILIEIDLPVPVLAEPNVRRTDLRGSVGEAREGTTQTESSSGVKYGSDSRGGQTPQQKWREKNKEKLAEYMRLYRAQKKLKEKT